jgi:hypothetical protein
MAGTARDYGENRRAHLRHFFGSPANLHAASRSRIGPWL